MALNIKTDFEFKGDRDYVHSSTLMEELCKVVYANFYPLRQWQMPKVDAQFRREIFSNGNFEISGELSTMSGAGAAAATFRFYDSKRIISAQFIEDEEMKVRHRIEPKYAISDMVIEKDFQGYCHINCSNLSAFIENVIEANKRIHLLTLKNKGDNPEGGQFVYETVSIKLPFGGGKGHKENPFKNKKYWIEIPS